MASQGRMCDVTRQNYVVKDCVSSLVKDNALPLLKDSALPVVKESTAATAMKESPLSLVKESPLSLVKENPVPLVKDSVTDNDNGVLDLTTKPKPKDQPVATRSEPASLCFIGEQEEALNLSLKATPTKKPVKNEVKVEKLTESPEMTKNDKTPVKHSTLPDRSNVVDMNQLVSCEMFTSLGKMQPYTVSMSTNSLLLMVSSVIITAFL
ncbi:uncharacterized protein LOC132715391 [Ruditapes philippinarum]|uniref:uncharacterized protein LOC132715391 n=1 Tax=Ruditapes philippinarum TaxID=129788 RepID=UPI00295C00A2|nr:uncharacterized protein LOC132715391 [Ruditapes philippinarum]